VAQREAFIAAPGALDPRCQAGVEAREVSLWVDEGPQRAHPAATRHRKSSTAGSELLSPSHRRQFPSERRALACRKIANVNALVYLLCQSPIRGLLRNCCRCSSAETAWMETSQAKTVSGTMLERFLIAVRRNCQGGGCTQNRLLARAHQLRPLEHRNRVNVCSPRRAGRCTTARCGAPGAPR
jgi:hypothetical protein